MFYLVLQRHPTIEVHNLDCPSLFLQGCKSMPIWYFLTWSKMLENVCPWPSPAMSMGFFSQIITHRAASS